MSNLQTPHDDSDITANLIISIMRKPHIVRTDDETLILKNSLRNIKFFREQFNQHYEDMLEEVVENAKLMMKTKGEIVFHQDNTGDLFYIIVKGSVKVFKKITYVSSQIVSKNGRVNDQYTDQIKLLTTLGQGDQFGELALMEKKPRAASIKCETDCHFLTLDKESFDRIIATKAKRQFMHLLDHLKQNSILRELSKNSVKALFLTMEKWELKYGDYVFKVNEQSDCIYFIAEGEFRLFKEIVDKKGSEEVVMVQKNKETKKIIDYHISGANETIGLEDFITDLPRSYSAQCQSQSSILFRLDRNDFKRLEQRYPDICQIIIKTGKDKKEYYQSLELQKTETKYQLKDNENVESVNTAQYVKAQKKLRCIMTADHDLSFISRDHVTLNEDNDIVMKFSRFFKIDEENYQPFQVNSIDQIHKNRVQSAKYQTKAKVATEVVKKKKKTDDSFIKFKIQTSQTRCHSAMTFQLSPKNETQYTQAQTRTTNYTPKSENSDQRVNYKNLKNRDKEALQQKMLIFLSLNQQRIEKMSKEAREQKEKYNKSKPYIKPYKQKALKTFVNVINKNVPTEEQDFDVKIVGQLSPENISETSSPKILRVAEVKSIIEQQLNRKRVAAPNEKVQEEQGTIHNYSEKRGVPRFKTNLKLSMDALQLPLKYHSAMLKLSAQSHTRKLVKMKQ